MVRWLGILFDAAVTVRYVGQQYEDDLNTLSLGGYFVMDAIISRAITRNVELYAAAENISDRVYTTGRHLDRPAVHVLRRGASALLTERDRARRSSELVRR